MQKWEYLVLARDVTIAKELFITRINGEKISFTDSKDIYHYLPELGQQGWELVSVEKYYYYFKRPTE